MNRIIKTDNAPAPIGPYNQAIEANNTLYVSGQIGMNPATSELVQDSLENETHQVMANLAAILKEAGYNWNNIVKCSIFLADMDDFPEVNKIYGGYFSDQYPARETVQVGKLPLGVNVEISAIAVK
ncbi:RidA family protein [bacterium SCSIO 12643]|nr:RidA family protein [bacterium SCSIO 12643]